MPGRPLNSRQFGAQGIKVFFNDGSVKSGYIVKQIGGNKALLTTNGSDRYLATLDSDNVGYADLSVGFFTIPVFNGLGGIEYVKNITYNKVATTAGNLYNWSLVNTIPSGSAGLATDIEMLNAILLTVQLSATTVVENTAAGTTIANISATQAGTYTYTLESGFDAGGRVTISGTTLRTTSTVFDYDTATSHIIKIKGVRVGDLVEVITQFTITVTNVFEQSSLAALTLAASTISLPATAGNVIGAIQNKTTGSVVDVFPPDARVSVSGNNLVVGSSPSTGDETFNITLRETLQDSPNSPRTTVLSVTATSVIVTPLTAALPVSGILPLNLTGLGIPSGNLINVALPAGLEYDVRYL